MKVKPWAGMSGGGGCTASRFTGVCAKFERGRPPAMAMAVMAVDATSGSSWFFFGADLGGPLGLWRGGGEAGSRFHDLAAGALVQGQGGGLRTCGMAGHICTMALWPSVASGDLGPKLRQARLWSLRGPGCPASARGR